MDVSQTLLLAEKQFKSVEVEKETPLVFDLGNLTSFDYAPLDQKDVTEEHLRNLSRDNCQLLLNEVFALPVEKTEDGAIAQLPEPSTLLPREKPLPKDKPKTRWEKFAKEKGIQKKKRSRMLWDEQYSEYRPRYGYKRANTDLSDWMVEVPSNADPYADPFAEKEQKKKERIQKNQKNQKRNLERAAKVVPPKVAGGNISKNEKKAMLDRSIRVTKTSTASLGLFDPKLKNEPKHKKVYNRKKYDPVTIPAEVEKSKAIGILDKLARKKEKEGVVNVRKAVNQLQVQAEKKARQRKRAGKKA